MNLKDVKEGITLGQSKKRVGRGRASGHGKTCGKGHKGYKSRKGSNLRLTYEGGQSPLFQRIAKRGFTNGRNKKVFCVVNLYDLEKFDDGKKVELEDLQSIGLVDNPRDGLKILGSGEVTKKLIVNAQAFSQSAKAAIEKAGGECHVVPLKEKKVSEEVKG